MSGRQWNVARILGALAEDAAAKERGPIKRIAHTLKTVVKKATARLRIFFGPAMKAKKRGDVLELISPTDSMNPKATAKNIIIGNHG